MIVVEVLDRAGRVHQRTRVAALPCTVGRAYACDVVVDDPTVSPQHLRLERADDGAIVATDLHTVNGTRIGRTRVTRVPVGADDRLRLGHTVIRIRPVDHEVAPAVPAHAGPRLVASQASALVALAAGIACVLADGWLCAYERIGATQLSARLALLLGAVTVWAGGWAFVSRVVVHRAQFLEHAAIATLAIATGIVAAELVEVYAFAFAVGPSATTLSWLTAGLLLTAVLCAHVRRCSGVRPARAVLAAAAVTTALLGGLALGVQQLRAVTGDPPALLAELKPPMFRAVAGRDVDGFFADADRLRTTVDRLEPLQDDEE